MLFAVTLDHAGALESHRFRWQRLDTNSNGAATEYLGLPSNCAKSACHGWRPQLWHDAHIRRDVETDRPVVRITIPCSDTTHIRAWHGAFHRVRRPNPRQRPNNCCAHFQAPIQPVVAAMD